MLSIDAIKGLIVRTQPHRSKRAGGPAGQQAPGTYRGGGCATAGVGPTGAEVSGYLSRVDAQWEHVGEYTVMDALDVLKREQRVYRVGNGSQRAPDDYLFTHPTHRPASIVVDAVSLGLLKGSIIDYAQSLLVAALGSLIICNPRGVGVVAG